MLDKEKVRKIATEYSEEVRRIFTPVSVILFGSYVNGNPHAESDIDIAVLVDNISDDDWYQARIALQKTRSNRQNVDKFIDARGGIL